MYKRRTFSVILAGIATLSLVIVLALVYAGFTGQLNINGTSVNRKSKWDIHFENLSSITTTGSAKVLSNPSLDGTTTIEDYSVSMTSPGDTISFTFKVVNDGNYNASISSINVSTPACTGIDATSNTNVCNKLTYTLTDENGSAIQVGDTVYAKDSQTMKVTLLYQEFSEASLLPTEDVSISNLDITINYQQSGSALVKDNGEVADYKVYHQGDKITLNNEDYWVIEDSGAGHISQYSPASVGTAYNVNGYGGIAYYSSETCGKINGTEIQSGCINDYDSSEIKYTVDTWTQAEFQNNELKETNNYKSRLITKEEYQNILTYNWRYGNYKFFTMSPTNSNRIVYYVVSDGSLKSGTYAYYDPNYKGYTYYGNIYDGDMVVRPVINVYKSALENNNNE